MKDKSSTHCNADGNRKNSLTSRSPYFIGTWLREFVLANYQLVGKSFMMKNFCYCIDMVFDLDERHDGSVVYQITDTDISIRALFTAGSLLKVNDSTGSESEEFSAPKLARSAIILEECKLLHLTIPGNMYGDFVLEVHSFTWASAKKFSNNHVEEILHLAPQFIWCSDDPELQAIVKKVYDKRGGGILSACSVMDCMELFFEKLALNNTTTSTLFIPPETAEAFALNNKEAEDPEKTNGVTGTEVEFSKLPSSSDVVPQNHEQEVSLRDTPKSDVHGNTVAVSDSNVESGKLPTSNIATEGKSANKNCSSNFFPIDTTEAFLLSDPLCSSPQMQPKVNLKRLQPSEISSYGSAMKTPVSERSFFLDSIRSKRTLPKWIPKSVKEKSPQFSKSPVKKNPKNLVGDKPENCIFDHVLQTELTASQIGLPLTDSLQVSLSEGDMEDSPVYYDCQSDDSAAGYEGIYDNADSVDSDQTSFVGLPSHPSVQNVYSKENKKQKRLKDLQEQLQKKHDAEKEKRKRQEKFGSVYQDAFSQWIVNSKSRRTSAVDQTTVDTNPSTKGPKKVFSNVAVVKNHRRRSSKNKSDTVKANEDTDLRSPKSTSLELSNGIVRSPLPRVVLSRLPSDVNLQTKDSINSLRDNKLKSASTNNAASTTDSDVEIVFESQELESHSAKKHVRHARRDRSQRLRQSNLQLPPSSNDHLSPLEESVTPMSTEMQLTLSKFLQTSTEAECTQTTDSTSTSTDDILYSRLMRNIEAKLPSKSCQESPKTTTLATDINIIANSTETPSNQLASPTSHKNTTITEGTSGTCSASDVLNKRISEPNTESSVNISADLQIITSKSAAGLKRKSPASDGNSSKRPHLDADITMEESLEGLQGKSSNEPQISTQVNLELNRCICSPWQYPDNLLSRVWKVVQGFQDEQSASEL